MKVNAIIAFMRVRIYKTSLAIVEADLSNLRAMVANV